MPTEEPGIVADTRLDALEREMAALRAELAALRQHVAVTRQAVPNDTARPAAQAASPAPSYDRRSSQRATMQAAAHTLEGMAGKYGTLVVATLAALAAVGTFLGWAIAHGMFGPRMRIAAGLVAALAVGVFGFRLRRRERSFGSTLIGLALAILHVCAWSAGPSLGIVAPSVAFSVAAVVSLALAMFAHRENDEPLWCVGFVGAAAAPFVTSSGTGTASMLAAYAAVVLIGGGYALASRTWNVAARLFVLASAVFTGALMALPEREFGPLLALALPLIIAFAGVLPFTDGDALRPRVRSLGIIAAAAALRLSITTTLPFSALTLAGILGAAGIALLALTDHVAELAHGVLIDGFATENAAGAAFLEACAIPAAFALSSVFAMQLTRTAGDVVCAVSAALLCVFAARRSGQLRDAAAFGSGAALFILAFCLTTVGAPSLVYALTCMAVLLALADRQWPSVSWVGVAALSSGVASVQALALLADRIGFVRTPFATPLSLAALVAVIGWIALSRVVRQADDRFGRATVMAAVGTAFAWGHLELLHAYNPTASIVLRISYYAAVSTAAVVIGRARGMQWLRNSGLLLSFVAAGTAFYSAGGLAAVGARVLAYFVVAGFLMGIAWTYRGARVVPAPAAVPNDGSSGGQNE